MTRIAFNLPFVVLLNIALVGVHTDAFAAELTLAEAAAWLDGYKRAWEERDADRVVGLFTEDAVYQENPHEEPYRGRSGIHEYWTGVTRDQRDVRFESQVLTTYGNTALAHWRSRFTSASSGAQITLDGLFLLEFEGELCSRLREWWHVKVEENEGG